MINNLKQKPEAENNLDKTLIFIDFDIVSSSSTFASRSLTMTVDMFGLIPLATESTGLLALPLELLIEILKVLPWQDVLYVRKTCKLLYEATKTRAIWANLVQEHISSKEVPPWLERPIEMHSSIELERLFLLWKSADIGWKKDDGRPARERSFPCAPAELTHLVDGGRWYLVTTRTGAVTYYDLNAETISGVQLIPPQYEPTSVVVALEIDRKSPVLKFNLAFSPTFCRQPIGRYSTRPPSTKLPYHAIHVWGVSSNLDDSGHIVGLSASQIAAFPHQHGLSHIFQLSLRGSRIAFLCKSDQSTQFYVVVVCWDQVDENHRHRWQIIATNSVDDYAAEVYLLPQECLFIITGTAIMLYDHSTVKETTEFLSEDQDMEKLILWERPLLANILGKKLGVFSSESFTKFVVSRLGYRLSTFNVSKFSSHFSQLVRVFEDRSIHYVSGLPLYALGPTRAVYYDPTVCGRVLMLLSHNLSLGGKPSLLEESHLSLLSTKKPPKDVAAQGILDLLALDDETGRMVVVDRGEGKMAYVLDFALSTGL